MFDCIGFRSISKFHTYIEYRTIFGNKKYYCLVCGNKISCDQFDKYSALKSDWYADLYRNAPKINLRP